MARHVVVDTGPAASTILSRDRGSQLARAILGRLGVAAVIVDPVAVEVDMLVRRRAGGSAAARRFWATLDGGVHRRVAMTRDLWLRAAEIDAQFADLDLGAVDAAVAAVAEQLDAPIFTWDFRDFGSVAEALGLRLLVDRGDLGSIGGQPH